VRVAVCVATFARRDGLRRLLQSLRGLVLDEEATVAKVVVVDNDPAGSARPVVDAVGDLPWPLDYVVEPRRGISAARNRAVLQAGPVDFVAFIDDDEWPEPFWLAELLRTQARTHAHVVVGPVVPAFESPPPSWFTKGGFLAPYRYEQDEQLGFAYTGNVLVQSSVLAPAGAPFSERFGLLGGEDTHFFMRVHLSGAKIVWAAEAVVHESVPAARMTASWLARREYRRGNTLSLCLRDLEDSPRRRFKRVAHGLLRIGQGTAYACAAILFGRRMLVRGLQRIAFGGGLITGLGAHTYRAYGGDR
jgi:glycosyltransferase involved in cell wall biosynthesis